MLSNIVAARWYEIFDIKIRHSKNQKNNNNCLSNMLFGKITILSAIDGIYVVFSFKMSMVLNLYVFLSVALLNFMCVRY